MVAFKKFYSMNLFWSNLPVIECSSVGYYYCLQLFQRVIPASMPAVIVAMM